MVRIQGVDPKMPVQGYKDKLPQQNEPSNGRKVKPAGDLTKQYESDNFGQDIEQMENALQQINKTMEMYNTELRFSLHKESGEYYVRVINPKDDSVIREIPPKRILDIVAHVKEMLGIIIDKHI